MSASQAYVDYLTAIMGRNLVFKAEMLRLIWTLVQMVQQSTRSQMGGRR
jgi:hypothetical protein